MAFTGWYRSGGASGRRWLPTCALGVALAAMACEASKLGDVAAGGSGGGAGEGPGGTTGAAGTSSAGTSSSAGTGGATGEGPGGTTGAAGTSSAGTSGSAGTGGGGAGGQLAACAPAPASILNPCVYAATAPLNFDLSVRGTLTSTGTTPPTGLQTGCRLQRQYFFTVQDAAGQSTAVGYNVAAGAPPPALAGLVGQTVSLRARVAWQFQYDTDSVGFALTDGAGALVFAAYGGIVLVGSGDAKLGPADLQGIEITVGDPLCAGDSSCGQTYHALQFRGSSAITLASGASGTVDAGGASYLAYHVATFQIVPQQCIDAQDWQSWSLIRDGAR